ncbi:hypothetical protein PGH12_04660 [Chryseobacterium wangxinyae]|uniref:hypothetical protein n=1 Tax=Chryseobacterium sp. CY350 TaxID=2997336 RepID=UPI002270C1AB|nr:hypothetical protein [Chryseobacterium sp. CY350]MCY0979412.1 hypothetical protein [Chryseobacterium sp. CY350]WBZ96441.1 hypothetical protein PGH12_04660 [Chryseobacterium sp. CY350]
MRNYIYIIVLAFTAQNCSTWKKELIKTGNYEKAINNAIIDFCHTSSLAKKNDAFSIYYKEYNSGIIGVSILGDDNKIYIVNGSPTGGIEDQYTEFGKKLFYWYDDKKGRDPKIIEKLSEYKVIDSVKVLTEDMGYIRDDAKKAVNYYFCKDNLSVYKKEMTSTAMPKQITNDLNCNVDIKVSNVHTHPKE